MNTLRSRCCGQAGTTRARPSRGIHTVRAATALPEKYKAVKPVGDRVFVKVDKEEGKTSGGLLLPAGAQKKPTAGSIVGVGDAHSVKSGDHVVYSKYAGTELAINGEDHVLLKEDDVIGVLGESQAISKLKPLGDRVLIKVSEAEKQTSGGVLLASDTGDKPTFGEVVAVGAGKKNEESGEVTPPNVKVGSTVLYSKYSGTEFQDDDDTQYIVVRESDVLAALS